MNCPRCGDSMGEVEKHGVTIDLCGNCGGIWLDKGELAKIVNHMREAEQSLDNELNAARRAPVSRREYDSHHDEHEHAREGHYYDDHRYEHDHNYKHQKKGGFQRLFDIFD